MATAYAARKLQIPAIIIVPTSTPKLVIEKLRSQEASVRVVGKVGGAHLSLILWKNPQPVSR